MALPEYARSAKVTSLSSARQMTSGDAVVSAVKREVVAAISANSDSAYSICALPLRSIADLLAELAELAVSFLAAQPADIRLTSSDVSSIRALVGAANSGTLQYSQAAELAAKIAAIAPDVAATAEETADLIPTIAQKLEVLQALWSNAADSDYALGRFVAGFNDAAELVAPLAAAAAAATRRGTASVDIRAMARYVGERCEASARRPSIPGEVKYTGAVEYSPVVPSVSAAFLPWATTTSTVLTVNNDGTVTVPATTDAYVEIDVAKLVRACEREPFGQFGVSTPTLRDGYIPATLVVRRADFSVVTAENAPESGEQLYVDYAYAVTAGVLSEEERTLALVVDNAAVDLLLAFDTSMDIADADILAAAISAAAPASITVTRIPFTSRIRLTARGARRVDIRSDANSEFRPGWFDDTWVTPPSTINGALTAMLAVLKPVLGVAATHDTVTGSGCVLTVNKRSVVSGEGLLVKTGTYIDVTEAIASLVAVNDVVYCRMQGSMLTARVHSKNASRIFVVPVLPVATPVVGELFAPITVQYTVLRETLTLAPETPADLVVSGTTQLSGTTPAPVVVRLVEPPPFARLRVGDVVDSCGEIVRVNNDGSGYVHDPAGTPSNPTILSGAYYEYRLLRASFSADLSELLQAVTAAGAEDVGVTGALASFKFGGTSTLLGKRLLDAILSANASVSQFDTDSLSTAECGWLLDKFRAEGLDLVTAYLLAGNIPAIESLTVSDLTYAAKFQTIVP